MVLHLQARRGNLAHIETHPSWLRDSTSLEKSRFVEFSVCWGKDPVKSICNSVSVVLTCWETATDPRVKLPEGT